MRDALGPPHEDPGLFDGTPFEAAYRKQVHDLLTSPEAANYRAFYGIKEAINEACEEAGLYE